MCSAGCGTRVTSARTDGAVSEPTSGAALGAQGSMGRLLGMLALCSMLSAFGCARVEVFQDMQDARLDRVYLKQGADFSRYNAVLIDTVSVWYPPGLGPDDSDLRIIEKLFREAMGAAVAGAYAIVTSPVRGTLRLHVEFIDLSGIAPGEEIPPTLRRYRFETAAGHITMVGELSDAATGEVLARAADRGIGQLWVRGEGLDRESVAIDFRRWAAIFRNWMDEVTRRFGAQR